MVGTSVAVYATILDGNGNAEMEFTLDDGQQQGSFAVPQAPPGSVTFRRLLWQSSTTDDKQHTLKIYRCQQSNPTYPVILLDYILYAATDSTPRSGLQYFVDDRDPRVKYNGSDWTMNSFPQAMEGTVTYTTAAESELEFEFEGR